MRLLQAGEAALSAVNAVGLLCVFFPWTCHLPNGRLKGSKEEEDKENDGRLQQDVAARTELAKPLNADDSVKAKIGSRQTKWNPKDKGEIQYSSGFLFDRNIPEILIRTVSSKKSNLSFRKKCGFSRQGKPHFQQLMLWDCFVFSFPGPVTCQTGGWKDQRKKRIKKTTVGCNKMLQQGQNLHERHIEFQSFDQSAGRIDFDHR